MTDRAITNEEIFLATIKEIQDQIDHKEDDIYVKTEQTLIIARKKLTPIMNRNTLKKYCVAYRKMMNCEVNWETAKKSSYDDSTRFELRHSRRWKEN
jgi:hypothetical protein